MSSTGKSKASVVIIVTVDNKPQRFERSFIVDSGQGKYLSDTFADLAPSIDVFLSEMVKGNIASTARAAASLSMSLGVLAAGMTQEAITSSVSGLISKVTSKISSTSAEIDNAVVRDMAKEGNVSAGTVNNVIRGKVGAKQ